MKDLCKDLGYTILERLMTEQSTTRDNIPWPTLWFKPVGPEGSNEDLPECQTAQGDQSPNMDTSTVTVKQEEDEDVKPKLATSICSAKYL